MNPSDLEHLARQGYTRVPLVRRLLADLDTPLGAYLRFAGPFSFLFESVEGGEKWGRYSIIGLPCRRRIVVRGREITLCDGDEQRSFTHADPLAFIEQTIALERVYEHPDLPMFSGGLVGYFGYDCVRLVEPRLAAGTPPDALGTPDILLLDAGEFLVFDNLAGAILLVVTVDPRGADAPAAAQARLDALQRRLEEPATREERAKSMRT
ncbi:MAG TPA: anthranilate synthase component I, partial [Pseudomonadales bacterium]|nr:anthranilate synthase component I [Pseudomonadales bacterium]